MVVLVVLGAGRGSRAGRGSHAGRVVLTPCDSSRSRITRRPGHRRGRNVGIVGSATYRYGTSSVRYLSVRLSGIPAFGLHTYTLLKFGRPEMLARIKFRGGRSTECCLGRVTFGPTSLKFVYKEKPRC